MKKKLITLAKELDFNSETEYYDYCIDSHYNGNFSQCRKLFNDMSKENQKELLEWIKFCQGSINDNEAYQFYFNLL
jgi:catalase